VDRFVHISSYNANPNSSSDFYRSKALGEKVVRDIFPETTIVRPGPMFGPEDHFLNKLAFEKFSFTTNHSREIVRPIYVNDVALALELMLHNDSTAGQTYELCSDFNYSMKEIIGIVEQWTLRKPLLVNLPKPVFLALAWALEFLWWPTVCRDEVKRQFIDQVIDTSAKTWRDIPGMHPPSPLDGYPMGFLRVYRHATHYSDTHEQNPNREQTGGIIGA